MNIRMPACGLGLAMPSLLCAQVPTAEAFKQVLNQALQKLRPDGSTERQVLFQTVRAGAPNGTEYPFQVTLLIRDYGLGYPRNRFYGETCVSRMTNKEFWMSRNQYGQWQANGAMTVTSGPDKVCKPNPSDGASSIPLASLQGTQAAAGTPAAAPPAAAPGGGLGLLRKRRLGVDWPGLSCRRQRSIYRSRPQEPRYVCRAGFDDHV